MRTCMLSSILRKIPFTVVITGSDMMANLLTEALQTYDPLSDCCIGLNCNWLEVEVELIDMKPLLTTNVLPSGGPTSH